MSVINLCTDLKIEMFSSNVRSECPFISNSNIRYSFLIAMPSLPTVTVKQYVEDGMIICNTI